MTTTGLSYPVIRAGEVSLSHEGATTTRNARGHHAIRPRDYQHEDRGYFFSNRVVKDYNGLPDYVKQAKTINTFKNCLDRHRGTPSRNHSRSAGPLRT